MQKGSHHSMAARQAMSRTRKGRPTWNKGLKLGPLSEVTRHRLSVALKGHRSYVWSDAQREHQRRVQPRKLGSANQNWKDGRSSDKKWLYWSKNKRNRLKKTAGGRHSYGEWLALKRAYLNECAKCHRREPEIKLTEDHIVPLSKNGTDSIENIQPLCLPCNSGKKDKIINYLQP